MLKKFASVVLASFRPSTLSEVGSPEGDFPFAKAHENGERIAQSEVCTSSGLHSLRPCWTNFLSIL
jgi:hypothetical protein